MTSIRLPVSGIEIDLRPPGGAEDVLLADVSAPDWSIGVRLSEMIAESPRGPVDWGELPLTDADALLLAVRGSLVADTVRADLVCANPECEEPFEIAFGLCEYLEHHVPDRPAGVVPLSEPGWFGLADEDEDVSFRLPRWRDLLEIGHADDPEGELSLIHI